MNEIFDFLKLKDNDLHSIFREIVSSATQGTPSEFISYCWTEYEKKGRGKSVDSSRNRNGQFLELLVQFVLCKNEILPFYSQARAAFVPNVNFDILIRTVHLIG